MAKAAIRKLKARRSWRWLCCEIYDKPIPKDPIKRRPPRRIRCSRAMLSRAWQRVKAELDKWEKAEEIR